ncbi:MAG: hypothetical protein ACLQOO_20355 [Terriglobia bacterium]
MELLTADRQLPTDFGNGQFSIVNSSPFACEVSYTTMNDFGGDVHE